MIKERIEVYQDVLSYLKATKEGPGTSAEKGRELAALEQELQRRLDEMETAQASIQRERNGRHPSDD